MRLVNKQPVNAEFFKRECVVLFFGGGKQFQFGFQFFLGGLQLLYGSPVVVVPFNFAQRTFQFIKLGLEKIAPVFFGHGDFFKAGMGNDDGVPISRCDAAHQLASFVLLKILFGRRQNVCARIKHKQLG